MRFSDGEETKNELPVAKKKTTGRNINDFLMNNVLAWFIHDWRVKKAYTYPKSITADSIYERNATGREHPIVITLAADWGSDTPQSEFVGRMMAEKKSDYTIHLGDTYYSGTEKEMASNFGGGGNDMGIWPRGLAGSFALAGNHEMFSSGKAYYDMITDADRGFGIINLQTKKFSGQAAPCFCLRTSHWCILGLDTGYQSLRRGIFRSHPDNLDLHIPDEILTWLKDTVKLGEEKRGILVLTHHQYMSAFNKEDEFSNPASDLEKIIPRREIIWICGHEHRFSMYGKFKKSSDHITAYVRCIGNGGMPDEHTDKRFAPDEKAKEFNLVLYDKRTADNIELGEDEEGEKWIEGIGFNGYALIKIAGQDLSIQYYASYRNDTGTTVSRDEAVIEERWKSDSITGKISCTGIDDFTSGNSESERLTYTPGGADPARAGR
jgi:hypothetical protein